ncbi:hypothetical protein FRC06_001283 [Ceratobasidium sp. 370]|nr:hypothetical protein FRC06_001283 [Ceratobasidium sp. 370]
MGMSHLWMKPSFGTFSLATPTSTYLWNETIASRCNSALNHQEITTVLACTGAALRNNDIVHPESFALADIERQRYPVRIAEIWVVPNASHILGLTVHLGFFGSDTNSYGMPSVQFGGEFIFVDLECSTALTKVIMQERQETSLRGREVQHNGESTDLILNVASLRSATETQVLRTPPKPLGTVQDVAKAVIAEWEEEQECARAEKEQKTAEKEAKKQEQERKKQEREKRKAERDAREQERQALAVEEPARSKRQKTSRGSTRARGSSSKAR